MVRVLSCIRRGVELNFLHRRIVQVTLNVKVVLVWVSALNKQVGVALFVHKATHVFIIVALNVLPRNLLERVVSIHPAITSCHVEGVSGHLTSDPSGADIPCPHNDLSLPNVLGGSPVKVPAVPWHIIVVLVLIRALDLTAQAPVGLKASREPTCEKFTLSEVPSCDDHLIFIVLQAIGRTRSEHLHGVILVIVHTTAFVYRDYLPQNFNFSCGILLPPTVELHSRRFTVKFLIIAQQFVGVLWVVALILEGVRVTNVWQDALVAHVNLLDEALL
mmetsp:Transcript_1118/g.2046  ORF Transcript_1118/g.2046 Transcript_1118/m.2046 type:complete len:275 (+) Transcript_1118:5036-5860(+)